MVRAAGVPAARDRAPAGGSRRRSLTILALLLAVVGPLVSVVGLTPQVVRTGNVSHWPWEEHGVLGWWLVPAFLLAGAAVAAARHRPARVDRLTGVLGVLGALTTLALLYNP
ncbi:hypothetical protein [Aquipuribacter sp. SD81]|uniref:hypothetical protein n=1 Tax=Aquipuribacter sp. SD81 TaxID=3127703 RepID=UPI00301A8C2F